MRYLLVAAVLLVAAAALSGPVSSTVRPADSQVADGHSHRAAEPRLALSRDGRHWRRDLRRPLLRSSLRWVPGDRRTVSLYLRHRTGRPVGVRMALRARAAGSVVRSGGVQLRVRAHRRGSGRLGQWDTLAVGRPTTVAHHLAKGAVVRVDVRVRFPARVRHRMDRHGHLRFRFRTEVPRSSEVAHG